jgi:hypothetical protein
MRIQLEKPHWSERLVYSLSSVPLLFLHLDRDDKTSTINYGARVEGDLTKNSIYVQVESGYKTLGLLIPGKAFPNLSSCC